MTKQNDSPPPYWLIFHNDKEKTFAIEGPVPDDSVYDETVSAMPNHIRIDSVSVHKQGKEEIVKYFQQTETLVPSRNEIF